LHLVDPASSIQLLTESLISIYEALKLLGELVVLAKEDSGVTFQCVFFSQVVVKVLAHILVGVLQVLNISTTCVLTLLSLFDLQLKRTLLSGHVHVASLSAFNVLAQVVTVRRHSVHISTQSHDFVVLLSIKILESCDLSLHVIKVALLVADIVIATLDDSLGLSDSHLGFLQIVLHRPGFVTLVHALSALHVLNLSQSLDLPHQVTSLLLHQVDISLQLSHLRTQVHQLVSLGIGFVSVLASLIEFLIKDAF
jgi:hypothetical protein